MLRLIRWTGKDWGRLALLLVFLVGLSVPALAQKGLVSAHGKLDKILNARVNQPGASRVIVMLAPGGDISAEVRKAGGKPGRKLSLINGHAVELPHVALRALARHPAVRSIHLDRPAGGTLNRVAVTVGARAVQREYGLDGAGIGVAVIDSGITSWHDDLTYNGTRPGVRTLNGQRVAGFVDFVNGRSSAYDDHGHGSHVAGIIAGNGYDSSGLRAGIAPAAHLVGLKVLDDRARGYISNVIAALEWTVANGAAYNLRIANLSIGAAVTESFHTDPLTVACKRVVEAGIVVVTAAGNLGRNADGRTQYGGITAPGNAPWVITVGAYGHEGTPTRIDDRMAPYSSRGPSAIDYQAKPDLVAPGTGTVSLSDPTSRLYTTRADYLLRGTVPTSYKPYLSLSGTSMAAPVVTGTVALMLQANPGLTPNLVKAILQYTAQKYAYNALTQGAGFINSHGAVQLASFYANATAGSSLSIPRVWSKEIIWGNHRLTGGTIRPNGNAWQGSTVWGAAYDADGENIVWGTWCNDGSCENIVWGTFDLLDGENIVWGTLNLDGENIVWGTFTECDLLGDCENIVWGSFLFDENIVWGTTCGGNDCENLVWGSTLLGLDENIVWGSSGTVDSSFWGATRESGLTWGSSGEDSALFDDLDAAPVSYDDMQFDYLFAEPPTDTSSNTVLEETSTTTDTESSTTSTSDTTTVSGILGGTL